MNTDPNSPAPLYAVYILDLYDHYRFQYIQAANPTGNFKGFLKSDALAWQTDQLSSRLSQEYTSYWAG